MAGSSATAEIIIQARDLASAQLKGVAREIQALSKNASAAAVTFGALGAAGVGLVRHLTLTAARTEELGIVVEHMGRVAGYTQPYLASVEEEIKGLGITTQGAREIMSRFIGAELDLADASAIARAGQDLAVIGMKNSSEAAADLTYALASMQPRILRQYGIFLNLNDVYEQAAETLGKNVDVLTAAEKRQGMLNAVLQAAAGYAGVYDTAMETAGKNLRSFPRYLEELSNAFGQYYLPALSDALDGAKELLKGFLALPEPMKENIAHLLAFGTALVTVVGATAGLLVVLPRLVEAFTFLISPIKLAILAIQGLPAFLGAAQVGFQLFAGGASIAQVSTLGFGAALGALALPLATAAAGFVGFYIACAAAAKAAEVHIVTAEELQTANVELSNTMATLQAASMNMDGTIGTLTATTDTLSEAEGRLTGSIEATGIATSTLTDGWTSQYSPALTNARTLTDSWSVSLEMSTRNIQELMKAEQGQVASLDLLTGSLTNATEVQRILDLQMGKTTVLAQTQEEAMSLLAWAYDTGTLSEEDYITAGLEVLAVNRDSIPGYKDVQEAVENATGGMYGLVASAEEIPGSMRGVVEAAQKASEAAEEMAKKQEEAWQSFASSVEGAVGQALEAYREGNVEMLAEQQRALANMLWSQTDTMTAMGQITADQAMGMKGAIATEFGVMVSDTELATGALLGLFGDWAAGGETSATDIVGFIQNIGEETETLVSDEEERISTMIGQWKMMQEGVGTESETIASHYAKMGDEFGALAGETETDATLVMGSMNDVTVSAALMADGAAESFDGTALSAGEMASGVVESTSIAMGGVTELADAIVAIPDFKKITIEVEIIGDEAGLPGSPQIKYYYMYQDLLTFIRENPLEIEALMKTGEALGGFGAAAAKRAQDPVKARIKYLEEALRVTEDTLKREDLLDHQRERAQEHLAHFTQQLALEKTKLLHLEEDALALEKQRQDLAFLQEQAKLLDLIKEHGLDAGAILGGIEMGIDADVGAIVQAMTAAMQAIIKQAEETLGIASQSTVFEKLGKHLMEGMAKGIDTYSRLAQAATSGAMADVALTGEGAVRAGPGMVASAPPSVINFTYAPTLGFATDAEMQDAARMLKVYIDREAARGAF